MNVPARLLSTDPETTSFHMFSKSRYQNPTDIRIQESVATIKIPLSAYCPCSRRHSTHAQIKSLTTFCRSRNLRNTQAASSSKYCTLPRLSSPRGSDHRYLLRQIPKNPDASSKPWKPHGKEVSLRKRGVGGCWELLIWCRGRHSTFAFTGTRAQRHQSR